MERSLAFIKSLPSQQEGVTKLTAQLTDREEEINSCKRHKRSLYEDYKEGIISKEDCIQFGKDYDERITELEQAITKLQGEIELLLGDDSSACEWLNSFTSHKGVESLTRQLTANLIERVEVFTGKRVSISFRYSDKMESTREILGNLLQSQGGAVNAQS